ncbi:archaea-specific SMC-related protein [Natrialba sp. INN-245]|uniref:archaea-specific SMC-related protein n=1 Tax=Natrialba sp. INN-245 TaxID=2690967 RepID=UPI00131046B7|nr:archaea-specific SMC-related protein [Natrialba sp. INN-245]MWV38434.1 AAA family ATPase [Natrialba sp. INN-245]
MSELTISIENVGGIDSVDCTLSDELNVVTGPNSSNKTSFLEAVAFGLGRSTVPIKNDADTARVELSLDGETIVRTATETGHGIEIDGHCWIDDGDDIELFEQFACLFEFSTVRSAVRNNENFEDVLKGPMDIDALEAEREGKIVEKNELQTEIEAQADVETRLEDRKRELDAKRETAVELEATLDELRDKQRTITDDEELEELQETRSHLVTRRRDYRSQIENYEDAIDRLTDQIAEVEAELEEARETVAEYDVESLESEKASIRDDLDEITNRLDILQSVLTANREMQSSPYTGVLGQQHGLTGDTVTCWACGTESTAEEFDETITQLTELIEADKDRRAEYEPRLEEINAQLDAIDEAHRRVDTLESKKRSLEEQLEERRDSLETNREQIADLEDEIDRVEDQIAQKEAEQESETSDLTDEIESTRIELHSVQTDIERLESTIDDLEAARQDRERNRERIESLRDEIRTLTERIENLEQRLQTQFNEAMDELIELLEYEAIERVWLDGNFDLIVAREENGVTRQDTIYNLSESEREMVGLVLALAGYIAYDVADTVPVLVIDTLGAFDAERATGLLEYFADESPLLVTALLPDNEAVLAGSELEYGSVNPKQLTP